MKEYLVEHNRSIKVYDDLLKYHQRHSLFQFIYESSFRIGSPDGNIPENSNNLFLRSGYSEDDLNRFQILDYVRGTELGDELKKYMLDGAAVNLSMPSDYNFTHVHGQDKILLYYANLEWKDGWHGETLFYNDKGNDVVFASPYTPGRFILFDGDIPHTIRPQSIIAAKYRFTFALALIKQ